MIRLKQLLMEAGASAGKLELASVSPEKAREYAEAVFVKTGTTLDKEIPNFDKNFKVAKSKSKIGSTQRKDMPVIDGKDVRDLQNRLSKGYIDINKPLSKKTNPKNPFPTGLSGTTADAWLQNGLKQNDGAASDNDDVVKVTKKSITVSKLKPIQRQIYFDKSMDTIAQFGVKASVSFMKTQLFIISTDNFIIDGHHRFQSMMLIDPTQKANVLVIDLPLSELLPMALSYSDAIGNKRNA